MKYGLSSSTPPRMSAPSSVCSDDSFEIVNNEIDIEESKDDVFSPYKPKVTFHEVFDVYPMDADIVAKVAFDHDYLKSDQDTVVVLPIAWKSVDQALCAANINGSYVRFDVKDLPKIGAEDKFYQLCYCTAEKIVMGVSTPFSFREVHEDELVEFQKEQNKEFWTFRSRFAVLTDNYWNSLMEKQVNTDQLALNSERELGSPTNPIKNVSKETEQDASELLRTSDHFSAEASEKEATKKSIINEEDAGEPCKNADDSDKLEENVKAQNNILLFKIMKAENKNIKQENEKLKAMVFDIIRAISINDRETCRQSLNNTLTSNGEAFDEEELTELRELLQKSLNEPDVIKSSEKSVSIPLAKVLENDESSNEANDSCESSVESTNNNERILLFKIMKNENAELKKQYEEQQLLLIDARNTIEDLKAILKETMDSTSHYDEVHQKIVNSISKMLKKKRLEADQCENQGSSETTETTAKDSVNELDANIAVLTEERDKLVTEVNEQQAIIRNLNEQLINQRQSEVEKMINVTNNMRDQYMKNMNKLTDSYKLLEDQLAEKQTEIETLNGNLLDASKLLTDYEREIRNLKDRDHTFVGFLERRNLKRISELRETLQVKHTELFEKPEVYSTRWAERQESAKLREDLLTAQTMLHSLCDELEKSSCKKSMENSAQTGDDVSTASYSGTTAETESLRETANDSISNASGTCSITSPRSLQRISASELDSTSLAFRRIKQREQALATKLVEMTSELEKLRTTHDKTKTDLESRLKNGAKEYAKLYMKYDKLLKRSRIQSHESSN